MIPTWLIVIGAIAEVAVGLVEWVARRRGPSRRQMRFETSSRILSELSILRVASEGGNMIFDETSQRMLASISVELADQLIERLDPKHEVK